MGQPADVLPLSQDTCRTTPVTLCFVGHRKLSRQNPHLHPESSPIGLPGLCIKGGITIPEGGLGGVRCLGGGGVVVG